MAWLLGRNRKGNSVFDVFLFLLYSWCCVMSFKFSCNCGCFSVLQMSTSCSLLLRHIILQRLLLSINLTSFRFCVRFILFIIFSILVLPYLLLHAFSVFSTLRQFFSLPYLHLPRLLSLSPYSFVYGFLKLSALSVHVGLSLFLSSFRLKIYSMEVGCRPLNGEERSCGGRMFLRPSYDSL